MSLIKTREKVKSLLQRDKVMVLKYTRISTKIEKSKIIILIIKKDKNQR